LLERRLKQKRDEESLPLKSDDENLVLARSIGSVDELLSKFYGRFPWPWPAMKFDYLDDPYLETVMVNQDLGDWTQCRRTVRSEKFSRLLTARAP
jgi:hypothetical protein